MGISLANHNYGYQTSLGDLGISILTLGSGYSYAQRHSDLAKVESPLGHRIIAAIEFIPVLGGIVSIIERIAYTIFGSYGSLRKKPLTADAALDKMVTNQNKAIFEHNAPRSFFVRNPYARSMGISKVDLTKKETTPLTFQHHFADAQGPRPCMEDAHFYQELDKGILAGVFDGHGGSQVSAYASKEFQKRFPAALKKADGNVHQAFENVTHQIHQDVANYSFWNHIGTTAVICYIDKETHQIYTATLGDSEANIYRKGWTGTSSIPLSCVRDWLSPKDRGRLNQIYGSKPVNYWIQRVDKQAKHVRSQLTGGVNVARTIGDVAETGAPGKPCVIHKPKITVNKIKAGDTLIIACDGLKDYVDESKITSIVAANSSQPVAKRLVNEALNNMTKGGDNVTVVAIQIA